MALCNSWKDPALIHFLEENKAKQEEDSFDECYIESIKCHHCDITEYIQNSLSDVEKIDSIQLLNLPVYLKSYSFQFDSSKLIDFQKWFYYFCKFGHMISYHFFK